jgi:hypothetical protein
MAMSKFVLLYSGGNPDMIPTEAEMAAVMKEWGAWYAQLGGALVDAGNPFTPVARTIESDGTISDAPKDGMATGYSIIEAESLDAAVQMAKGCPILKSGGRISVYETFVIM